MSMDIRGEVRTIAEAIEGDPAVQFSARTDACKAHPRYRDLLALGEAVIPVLFGALAEYADKGEDADVPVSPHIAMAALEDLGITCEITAPNRGRVQAMAGEWAARGRELGFITEPPVA